MLWTKQIYLFDVNQWLEGDAVHRPLPESRRFVRNNQWRHLNSMRILSMPDKWEFPWFAAWDLAFHVLPLALVDPDFAKEQLWVQDPYWRDLILFHEYFHAESGEGLGASHQTGWTGLVASLIDEWRRPGRGRFSRQYM